MGFVPNHAVYVPYLSYLVILSEAKNPGDLRTTVASNRSFRGSAGRSVDSASLTVPSQRSGR